MSTTQMIADLPESPMPVPPGVRVERHTQPGLSLRIRVYAPGRVYSVHDMGDGALLVEREPDLDPCSISHADSGALINQVRQPDVQTALELALALEQSRQAVARG